MKYKLSTFAVLRKSMEGALAQLVERFNGIEEVKSSNLLCSTIFVELIF